MEERRRQGRARLSDGDDTMRTPGTTTRGTEMLVGDIARELGVSGGMPDNWEVTGGTIPPVGPYGATDSGERDLRGEHDPV